MNNEKNSYCGPSTKSEIRAAIATARGALKLAKQDGTVFEQRQLRAAIARLEDDLEAAKS